MGKSIFGDKMIFAIETRKQDNQITNLENRRIWINGKPLIDFNEAAFIPTFDYGIKKLLVKINNLDLWNNKFDNKTKEEIFNLISQSKELHVNDKTNTVKKINPVLGEINDEEYFKYLVLIDETIDQYQIFVLKNKSTITFIWRNRGSLKIQTGSCQIKKINDIIQQYLTREDQ